MLIDIAETVAVVATILLGGAVLFFCIQCILGSWTMPSQGLQLQPRASTAILIPAHDEEQSIGSALDSLLPQIGHHDRLVVIADNCTDKTADVARERGAEVLIRKNPYKRGKAHALDAGIRYLAGNPPDVVVVVDADCVAAPDAVGHLVNDVHRTGRPVQACYVMTVPPGASPAMAAREFAFLIKNRIRLRGLSRLGLPCHLTGSGMAFPWTIIAKADFADAHLVEDMKLGLELASSGQGARFCDRALVSSSFPLSRRGLETQADRWEKGRLQIAASCAAILVEALRHRQPGAALLALDALIPPATLLVGLATLQTVAAAALALAGGALWPAIASSAVIAVLAVVLAWLWLTQGHLPLSQWGALPMYALAKLRSYPRILGTRRLDWIRTDRSPDEA
jgi:cellulose synthase/poly-beta-1,6-N-acetylglucosamine synthase-like glycosyltransferase